MKKPIPEVIYDWQALVPYLAKKLKWTKDKVSEVFGEQWNGDFSDNPSNDSVVQVWDLSPEFTVLLKTMKKEFGKEFQIRYWW
jgi:hypothetical protein